MPEPGSGQRCVGRLLDQIWLGQVVTSKGFCCTLVVRITGELDEPLAPPLAGVELLTESPRIAGEGHRLVTGLECTRVEPNQASGILVVQVFLGRLELVGFDAHRRQECSLPPRVVDFVERHRGGQRTSEAIGIQLLRTGATCKGVSVHGYSSPGLVSSWRSRMRAS